MILDKNGGAADEDRHGHITCDLLTGYLGSGKSTLLNRYLRAYGSDGTAVVVNEIGEIGIDQLILSEVSENVVLLDSGCLCCSLSGSLRETLLELKAQANRLQRPLRRVIVETTGLAEPMPVLHSLLGDKILADQFSLGRIVVTVDAQHSLKQVEEGRETVRQIAVADVLVTTKSDLVGIATFEQVSEMLSALNPRARRVLVSDLDALERIFESPIDAALSPAIGCTHGEGDRAGEEIHRAKRGEPHGERRCDDGAHHAHHHGRACHGIVHESLWYEGLASWIGIAAWWHLVVERYGSRLLRCKGLLQLSDADRSVYIQGVGRYLYPLTEVQRGPIGDPRSRLVLIGEGLERDWLRASVKALSLTESGVKPATLDELYTVLKSQ